MCLKNDQDRMLRPYDRIRPDDCRRPNSGDHQDRPYTDRQPIPTQPGAYFVTVRTRDRACLFGHVVNGEMHLNDAGEVARRCWEDIPTHFPTRYWTRLQSCPTTFTASS
jgi:hypothetical protein